MFKSIVVGVDFTPCSANALRQAMRLAAGATLRVVHVIDTLVVVDIERSTSPAQRGIQEGLERDARAAWRDFAAAVPGAGDLPFDVYVNSRVAGILAAAREHGADLLILGAFGHRRPDVGIGTIASACVRHSPIDVLLIRDTHAGPFERIVCGVDFSDTSRRALDAAARLAAGDRAELHVLHVFDAPWNYAAVSFGPDVNMPGRVEYQADLARRLNAFADDVRNTFPELAVKTCCYDKAGHRSGINEYANGVAAQLIALGTRGRSNLRDMLLGSTAEKSLQASRCSVLAVKPEMAAG